MAVSVGCTDEEPLDFTSIDVEDINILDDQIWLTAKLFEEYSLSNEIVDINEYYAHVSTFLKTKHDTSDFRRIQVELMICLGAMAMYDILQSPAQDKQKFDSRTYTRPKRRSVRPSLQAMVESGTKTITKQPANGSKASSIIRHRTFTLDVDGVSNPVLKEYAARRMEANNNKENQSLDSQDLSLQPDDQPASMNSLSKPIDINLSEPVHNLHNTFSRRSAGGRDRSLSIGRCDDSFMNVSPPSMVSSIAMDTSGNFNSGSFMSRKGSLSSQKDLNFRDTLNSTRDQSNISMVSSMTNSFLDEREMNTSFLSQTPCLDNESLLGSLPLSLASSFNSTIASAQFSSRSKLKDNLISSGTFTRLVEPNDDSSGNRSQFGLKQALNRLNLTDDFQNISNKSPKKNILMQSYIVEKENMNDTFMKDEEDILSSDGINESALKELASRPSLNLTMDKQELNEIISARQKLSLARSSLPLHRSEDSVSPRNASMKKLNESSDSQLLANRFSPIRNGSFRKLTPPSKRTEIKNNNCDNLRVEDIAYTTISVVDKHSASTDKLEICSSVDSDKISNKELCERTMACSSDSLEGGATGSSISGSGSPPEIGDDNNLGAQHITKYREVTSTPQQQKTNSTVTLFHVNALSPIMDPDNEDSQILSSHSTHENTIIKTTNSSSLDQLNRVYPEDTAMVKRQTGLRSPEKRQSMYAGCAKDSKTLELKSQNIAYPQVRKSGLPTSKLRQYSSHKELSKIPGGSNLRFPSSGLALRGVSGLRDSSRAGVYASNPALSPTAPYQHPIGMATLRRKGSYTIMGDSSSLEKDVDDLPATPAAYEQKLTTTARLVRQIPPSDNKRLLNRPREMRESLLPTSNSHHDNQQMSTGHYGLPLKAKHNIPAAIGIRQSITGSLQTLNRGVTRPISSKPSSASAKELSQPSRSSEAAPSASRPSMVPPQPVHQSQIPAPKSQTKASGLPRPSRLPAPRRSLRPPSTYSLPQTTGEDYDCC